MALAKALLSLPALRGFEYGAGFSSALMRGSQNNDQFVPGPPEDPQAIATASNRHGGMLGGISSMSSRSSLAKQRGIPQPTSTSS